MSRSHLIRIEDGKTREFYGEIKKNDEEVIMALYDSETARFSKAEYDLKKCLPSFGTTATSIMLVTPDTQITLIFDTQNEKMSFFKAMTSSSLVKKDNDYISLLQTQMAPTYVFPMNGLYQ